MTNREVISRVRSTNKLFSDATLNDRSILSEVKGNAAVLINQRTNQRKLWATSTIFTTIDCLEMEQVDMGECCGYKEGGVVSRSKLKLPSIIEGNYQYVIQGVYDAASTREIKHAPLNRYINLKKLGLENEDVYYWFQNNHLYISSPYATLAKITAAFDGEISFELLYPECDCSGKRKHPCTSRLDEEFKCPASLISPAVTMTTQTLLSTYFRIPTDHTANNKDDQTNKA